MKMNRCVGRTLYGELTYRKRDGRLSLNNYYTLVYFFTSILPLSSTQWLVSCASLLPTPRRTLA
jgi:hypothetical protein